MGGGGSQPAPPPHCYQVTVTPERTQYFLRLRLPEGGSWPPKLGPQFQKDIGACIDGEVASSQPRDRRLWFPDTILAEGARSHCSGQDGGQLLANRANTSYQSTLETMQVQSVLFVVPNDHWEDDVTTAGSLKAPRK